MAPDAVGVASKISVGKNGGTTTSFSSSSSSGRHSLKKGPWTAAEDAILMEYVKKHGEGNWNAVQRNSGLMRCGKSCRLRWANHLRPNLKKGAFCSEEEALIVELHSKLGNKWARMAAQLPGRTDNEIKNYWNTRLKRRQRAGLPIYPHDVNGGKAHTYYHHHLQQQQQENIQAINNNNPSSSSPLTSFLSPPPPLSAPAAPPVAGLNPGYRTPLSIFDMFSPSVSTMKANGSYLPNLTCSQPFKFFQENNNNIIAVGDGSLALSLSQPPPAPSSLQLINNNQGLPNSLSMPNCIQYNNCLNFGTDSTPPAVSGLSFEQSTGRCGVAELPSIQSLVPRATSTTTPTSSDNNGSDDYNMIATTSSDADDHEDDFLMRGNSGLLEDLIDESQALTRSEKSKEIILPPVVEIKSQDNYLWDYKVMEGLNLGQDNNVIHDKHVQDSTSPAPSSIRANAAANNIASTSEESNPVDDDFLSLLDNFPMSVPVPDWCNENETMANGHDSNPAGSSLTGKENQNQNHEQEQEQESSNNFLAGTTSKKTMMMTDHNFDIGACCWKNLPGIYQM